MSSNQRLRTRGARRTQRILLDLSHEYFHARVEAGLSQEAAGNAAGLSADKVWRMEHARSPALSIADASALASVLGLDISVRAYPNGSGVRDAAQTQRLGRLLTSCASPLRYQMEVALPQKPGEPTELRSWDGLIRDATGRTAVEYESRLTDIQAMLRRHGLKRRDDPVDAFLLVIADTAHNRRVMREFNDLLPDLQRLRTAAVLGTLRNGVRPSTGWMFF